MEETIKNRIILILAVLTAIFFIGTIGSCRDAFLQKSARDKEMAKRLDSEEKMSKFAQDKTALEEKVKKAENELEEEKTAHQATKKALTQEQLVNQSLKDELQKVTKLKETLEEDLKEALTTSKSPKPKK
jgi:chromosome segregation ATPase